MVWRIVDWNRWREHTVEYDEYQAKVKYGACMASTNYISVGDKGVVQDLDVGQAVRALTGAAETRPERDPLRGRKYTFRHHDLRHGRMRRW